MSEKMSEKRPSEENRKSEEVVAAEDAPDILAEEADEDQVDITNVDATTKGKGHDGTVQIKVTKKNGHIFYQKACRSFLLGNEKLNRPVHHQVELQAMGSAISIAVGVAARMESEGNAFVSNIETGYATVPRGTPQIHICLTKKTGRPSSASQGPPTPKATPKISGVQPGSPSNRPSERASALSNEVEKTKKSLRKSEEKKSPKGSPKKDPVA